VTSAPAALPLWAATSRNATNARTASSPITPVAIGIVPSVSPRPGISGSPRGPRNCSPCRIVTSSLPSLNSSRHWLCKTSESATACCSGRCRIRCSKSPPIPGIWERRSAFLAVLHTWSQNLLHHPHVHCVVPAGGLSPDGYRWIPCRPKFFLPVRVLSRLFRGKLLALLRHAFADGRLEFFGQLTDLAEPARFHAWLRRSKKTERVVYAKPPFGGPEHVLKYLARYTHRVAISSGRLLSLDNGRVTFRWRDSRHGNQAKSMTVDAVEFIRRFLLHILPSGFMKTRVMPFGMIARGLNLAIGSGGVSRR
jgi:hypothetical protein